MNVPQVQRAGSPSTLAWLCSPITLLALVLLLVNDHLLKQAFPGPLTGKLSDIAGLLLTPPLVAVLLTLLVPRLPARAAVVAGLVAVGAGFTLVKSSGYAAELASSAWSASAGPSLVLADRTDLLVLPALALAWWTWTRARQGPLRYRLERTVRLLVVLPPALVAVTATSAVYYPYAVGATLLDEQPAISIDYGYNPRDWPGSRADGHWTVSTDGATTWRVATDGEQRRLSGSDTSYRQACVAAEPRRCYRVVVGHLRVEQSDDAGASWRVAWELSDGQREKLARQYSSPGDLDRHFASRELIVYPTANGGHGVLVANGRDGFVRRLPDGQWRRDGFPGEAAQGRAMLWEGPPVSNDGGPGQRRTDVLLAVAVALTLGFLVTVVAAHLHVRRRGGSLGWGLAGGLALLAVGVLLTKTWPRDDDFGTVLDVLIFVLPLGAVAAFTLLVVAWRKDATYRWTARWFGAFVLTLLLVGLPLTGWLFGRPPDSRAALLLAGAATVPGLVLAWRAARAPDPVPPRGDPPYPPPTAPAPPG
ncbi:hypothetical protein V6V47_19820 [Micromonospora sp. CPCC 205539]|uniref:hypothetical protein n=1 Tax=Micromonospora sp. CPCC 205539 TaxID=3122408 RepID=UPI002FF272E3